MLDKGNSDQSNKTVMTLMSLLHVGKIEGMNDKIHSLFGLTFCSQFMALKSQLSISLLKIRLCLTIPVSLMAILKRLKS